MGECRWEATNELVEVRAEGEMGDRVGKGLDGLVEEVAEREGGEGGREGGERLVEGGVESETCG